MNFKNGRWSNIQIKELKTENIKLKREYELQKGSSQNIKSGEYFIDFKNQNLNKFGLINLARLNEEAVFDAINTFNKSCPYCGKDLYEGNIRIKIEIDHFFPISKGGQDFPWNILPICKECNRRKRNKMPHEFLSPEKYNECLTYLTKVQNKITSFNEDKLQNSELTYSLLLKYLEKSISKENLINEILVIYKLNSSNHSIITDFKQFNLSLVKDFFDNVKIESQNFMEYQDSEDRIIFSLAEAIKIYKKKITNERKRVDLLLIRHIFRSKFPFVIEYGKVMKLKSRTSRCIILSYSKMDDEWKSLFDSLIDTTY